jgi:hypothetical protein
MGAQLLIDVTSSSTPETSTLTLVGPNPDGSANDPNTFVHVDGDGIAYKVWPENTLYEARAFVLYANGPDVVGCNIRGTWSLGLSNSSVSDAVVVDDLGLFVEGIGRDSVGGDGLGAAAFEFGIYADPAHLAENGTPADFAAARLAIDRIKQAHTLGDLLLSLSPYPDEVSGVHAAIPGEAIPV